MREYLEDKKRKAELGEGRPDVCTFEGTLESADFDKLLLGEVEIGVVGGRDAGGISTLEEWWGFSCLFKVGGGRKLVCVEGSYVG